MKELNILFLGGAKRVSLAEHFIKSAKGKGFNAHIFSYELNDKVPVACIAEIVIGLKWKDETILSHLSDTIIKNNIQIVLPFVDPAIEIVSRLKKLNPSVFMPCCSEETAQIMFDKKSASSWFCNHNFPIPEEYSINGLRYPVILKPRQGSASRGILIINSFEELKLIENIDSYLIQKYLTDITEYTVDCYVSAKNQIISIVPRIRLETAGGEVLNSITIRNKKIIGLSEEILKTQCFQGPVTLQFIRDNKTDEVFIMEINPRLGGGVIASIEAGADILSIIIDEYLGSPLTPITGWKENTLMTRYFKEVIFYANNN